MKPKLTVAFGICLIGVTLAGSSLAQPILHIDFNARSSPGLTYIDPVWGWFDAFVINSVDGTGVQTNATVRYFGDYVVTLSANPPILVPNTASYSDRIRDVPADAGDFTQSLLLRDFVFCTATSGTDSGLDIKLDGLIANMVYQVTIWSYDNSSTGTRISDWFVNNYLVKTGYIFDGSVLPTNNDQYQFSFKVLSSETGTILIQGRRNANSRSGHPAVFINALVVEESTVEGPSLPISPTPQRVYAGETAIFSSTAAGLQPLYYQWFREGIEIANATIDTLILRDVQVSDAVQYFLSVSNLGGVITSEPVDLTVLPVADITTALISYWPLDELTTFTPDITTNINDLWATNLDATALVTGYRSNAIFFNGTNSKSLLYLELTNAPGLPVYSHESYSVALWVKGNATNQPGDVRVFSESANTNNTPLLNIGTHNAGTNATVDMFIRFANGGNPLNHRHSELAAFNDAWHHIVWVDDKGLARLYVDGVQDTNDFSYTRGPLDPNILSIGGILRSNAGNWFTGVIDDVAVWSRALRPDEVTYVMNNGPMVVVSQPRITSIQLKDNQVQLEIESDDPPAAHRVEEVRVLPSTDWAEVQNVIFGIPAGNRFTATFPVAIDGNRYYRVVRP